MIVGASCSGSPSDYGFHKPESPFPKVLAWYLRWKLIEGVDLQSENLWAYQALLLLEIYENTYSSSIFHKRTHIHSISAITLIRRAGFLKEKAHLGAPECYGGDTTRSEEIANVSVKMEWHEWIKREATRRVVYAAFLMNSVYAAMFGHSIGIVAHEIYLVLPCDEAQWLATSFGEVRKIQIGLQSHGIRPILFVEGLQTTLACREICTSSFGRSILMCGLISVTCHMTQREAQASSLCTRYLGTAKKIEWRRIVEKALNFGKPFLEQKGQSPSDHVSGWSKDSYIVFGNGSTLFYLAQFNLYADLIQCQIFAGADRVLGRTVARQEMNSVEHQIRNVWAPTMEARSATFYALRLLCSVFRQTTDGNQLYDHKWIIERTAGRMSVHQWVLYFAALIVWCYSYAVGGPSHLTKSTGESSIDAHIQDMGLFLQRVEGKIRTPKDVSLYHIGDCVSVLKVLCHIFRKGSWELLCEEADLLTNCISLMEVENRH